MMMLKVSIHALFNVLKVTSHCSACDDQFIFSGSKELKDQLFSLAMLRLWQSGSRTQPGYPA